MPVRESKRRRSEPQSPVAASSEKKVGRAEAREALNMRVRPEVRNLIDHAAALTGKNRTDFVLDAARHAAQTAILDQTVLSLSEKSYSAFVALLDAPPKANAHLRKTMQTKPVWE
jgi:uncharacterized protein (DUF1778 family)